MAKRRTTTGKNQKREKSTSTTPSLWNSPELEENFNELWQNDNFSFSFAEAEEWSNSLSSFEWDIESLNAEWENVWENLPTEWSGLPTEWEPIPEWDLADLPEWNF